MSSGFLNRRILSVTFSGGTWSVIDGNSLGLDFTGADQTINIISVFDDVFFLNGDLGTPLQIWELPPGLTITSVDSMFGTGTPPSPWIRTFPDSSIDPADAGWIDFDAFGLTPSWTFPQPFPQAYLTNTQIFATGFCKANYFANAIMVQSALDFPIDGYTSAQFTADDTPLDIGPVTNIHIIYFELNALVTWDLPDNADESRLENQNLEFSYGSPYGALSSTQANVPYTAAVDGVITFDIRALHIFPFTASTVTVTVEVVVPDLDTDLVIDMALDSVITAMVNPSGIYTMVQGQHYDILYDRNTATTTTQTVKIPNPFVKTYYWGE